MGDDGGGADERQQDRGDFRLDLRPATEKRHRAVAGVIRESGFARLLVDGVNGEIRLPRDVLIRFSSSPQGPHWAPRERMIRMPYAFLVEAEGMFEEEYPKLSKRERLAKVDDVAAFVLLHEIGHALVNQLDLPITGREEDAVDDLATVLLVTRIRRGGEVALDAAILSDLDHRRRGPPTDDDFWDEHSLKAQRYRRTVCLVYGSDRSANARLEDKLPDRLEERCPGDWSRQYRSWNRLLAEHFKR